MFIKTENGKITSWANWEFEDSVFVELDYETFDPERYSVSEEGLVDISDSFEYRLKKLNEEKVKKNTQNEIAREVEYIQTTFGKLKTKTPIGDLKVIIPNIVLIAQLQNGLPEGFLRFYDENNEPKASSSFTQMEALSLYGEIVAFYNKLDLKSTQITEKIKNAKTLEELEEIEISY